MGIRKLDGWKCEYCNQIFKTRKDFLEHKKEIHSDKRHFNQYTKAKFLGKEKPLLSEETRKKLSKAWKGKNHTEEQKRKISESMKKAHMEGRAHNIGECRWNNKPSYPEEWFIKMMKNEFGQEIGKDYQREFSFHRFSLDFAWPDKKFCVEIDGEQHQKFQEQKQRDIEKDKLLKEEGWIEIREEWKNIFNDPKKFIERIRGFSSEA